MAMSVMVSDSNGNPVASAVVTLGLCPSCYATGFWVTWAAGIVPWIEDTFPNEDEPDRNLILDPGEDANGDGELTPPNSAAGTVPLPVTTDENGVANFELYYLKKYAVWIEEEIRASTMVLGTETQSIYKFWMPYEQ